ncbi:MAG TPA: DNA topoisomerase VI subunit B [Anaerohalosphaeraceae bacterium]|nr:DNA topoisomerase VI subunit B [Anaerohalosphaeraceae bacterium]HOL30632.1 DNA topoisomerase VI subunit B [Anaerohalosphaeraceae bacterium]HOM75297.1 DNA topoisomerase VI subunit B [Anaerohalosphaeraceae bacterium]HPC63103.1 DNA topoisomerase VI subunit B [Anaerohalosphaeraceae bacterium]HPO69927.1 DNA topoisomerase VI subunit B [Anaerohalosphaeraceae bacterium]
MTSRKTKQQTQMRFEFGTADSGPGQGQAHPSGMKSNRKRTENAESSDALENLNTLQTPAAGSSAKAGENAAGSTSAAAAAPKKVRKSQAATAESMAAKQREISVSEFFAKNRHLLGFDNPRKALLTAVKEAVDNSLDACEEAQILPAISVHIEALDGTDNKFRVTVKDNGPGIVPKQIPNIFARLLYGSKFHTLKMSRGQQGIGISAAGMYGLLTTGEPVQIISRTSGSKPAKHYHVQIDTSKNRPEVILDEECEFDQPSGTSVSIVLEGRYQKGRQSVDEYLAQTAMANPHASITYRAPDGTVSQYPRQTEEMPYIPAEIKPHPYGVELGILYKMARDSECRRLADFMHREFSRVSERLAAEIIKKAKLSVNMKPAAITLKDAEKLHAAINATKLMAPPTDCISPIGQEKLIDGLKRVTEAEFYVSCTRKPAVYRGNPFIIEAALAYGCKEMKDEDQEEGKEPLMRLVRFANRVPLLYQQSACATYKAVMETNWRAYGLNQSKGALPSGPVMLMVHIASVWVPFTSESKEAVAHYPEIIKEIKLAIQECGRKLGLHVRRQRRMKEELLKRSYIETYLPHIGQALKDILLLKEAQVEKLLNNLSTILERTRSLP